MVESRSRHGTLAVVAGIMAFLLGALLVVFGALFGILEQFLAGLELGGGDVGSPADFLLWRGVIFVTLGLACVVKVGVLPVRSRVPRFALAGALLGALVTWAVQLAPKLGNFDPPIAGVIALAWPIVAGLLMLLWGLYDLRGKRREAAVKDG